MQRKLGMGVLNVEEKGLIPSHGSSVVMTVQLAHFYSADAEDSLI